MIIFSYGMRMVAHQSLIKLIYLILVIKARNITTLDFFFFDSFSNSILINIIIIMNFYHKGGFTRKVPIVARLVPVSQ